MTKRTIANALKYSPEDDIAPKVVAKGRGFTADKIKELAEKNGIPIYRDEKLSKQLYNLSIGDEIPQELYNVVAEVLSFIARLDDY
ncbi:EscU/YscU/HrcU family type III secretion system export apparatus switch protein [Wukongibacter baidiensis]|uniref:EscU/YscU/HrcU family type III secretion system export apparatus switch protein n=1 Tax=Wukongibacter baidiensis TaxID=1723361 RepID=UPI003D7FE6FC